MTFNDFPKTEKRDTRPLDNNFRVPIHFITHAMRRNRHVGKTLFGPFSVPSLARRPET